jgi:hypothetical protein
MTTSLILGRRRVAGDQCAGSETRVLKYFQERMPYGFSCQTLREEYSTAPGVSPPESSRSNSTPVGLPQTPPLVFPPNYTLGRGPRFNVIVGYLRFPRWSSGSPGILAALAIISPALRAKFLSSIGGHGAPPQYGAPLGGDSRCGSREKSSRFSLSAMPVAPEVRDAIQVNA